MIMRIAIDGRFASGQKTGVGKYTYNLVKALSKLILGNELLLFLNEGVKGIDSINVKIHYTKVTPEAHPYQELWENLILPIKLKRYGVSLFHSPAFFLPIFSPGIKKVVTIHDLGVFKFSETFPERFAEYLKFMVRISVKVSDRIIAVSHSVRTDLVDILKVNEEKISVIHEGIDEVFVEKKDEGEISNFRESKGLTRGFILYAGTIEPRKNIINLIRAFNILKERRLPYKLVLAGKKGWLCESVFEETNRSKFKDDIIMTGYIPDEELKLYYSACDVFVYPSLYEGFGLPPLEAIACGTPVVVSDIRVFREILEDSVFFIDPEKSESIAEGIFSVLNDHALRQILREKGNERVKRYSWTRAAKETLGLYETLI